MGGRFGGLAGVPHYLKRLALVIFFVGLCWTSCNRL